MVVGGCVVGPLPQGTQQLPPANCDLCGRARDDVCDGCKPFINAAKGQTYDSVGELNFCSFCRRAVNDEARERGFCDQCRDGFREAEPVSEEELVA